MGVYDLFLLPVLFGLVGFFEPCSLGINLIFLNRIQSMKRQKRVWESIIFTSVRAFILALVGLAAAFIGGKFITIQASLFMFLGIAYILLGILIIINMYRPIFKTDINLAKYVRNRGAISLGVIFGLVIPACAIAFVLALIGKAAVMGNLFEGFLSLFVFGITLSAPLVMISYSERSTKIIQKIAMKMKKIPWIAGAVLILVGLLTMLTSVWWSGAL